MASEMTAKASFTQTELARAIRAADAAGKVALVTRQGIALVDPALVALPSPEPARVNTCDEAFGTGS